MIWPILFVVGLAYAGLKIGQQLKPRDVGVGGTYRVGYRPLPAPRKSHCDQLTETVARGERPSRFLVAAATREAYDKGDWGMVADISELFHGPHDAPAVATPADPTAPVDAATAEAIEVAAVASPLTSVSDDDWAEFRRAMATKPHTHRTERHHGRYEHNLGRLRQLGQDPPGDEAGQDAAFAADMVDYWNSQAKLIADYSGDVVDVDGQPHAITASGVLGLLKAAGPQGAASWLANEADRRKFPHTTQTFVNANGCF